MAQPIDLKSVLSKYDYVKEDSGLESVLSKYDYGQEAEPETPGILDTIKTTSENLIGSENTEAISKTLKGYGEIAKNPTTGLIGGAIEFASALPPFFAGVVGGAQDLAKRAILGDFNLNEYYDAASEGFQRESAKIPSLKSVNPGAYLVGETALAPMMATMALGHELANSDILKGIPQEDNVRGFLKFGADIAGLYAQHGIVSRTGGPFIKSKTIKKIIETELPKEPVVSPELKALQKSQGKAKPKNLLADLAKDIEAEITKEFELDPKDVRLKTPEGRQEILTQIKSDFEKLSPDEVLAKNKANQKTLNLIPDETGGETARTRIEEVQRMRDLIALQDKVTANELSKVKPIGDIIAQKTEPQRLAEIEAAKTPVSELLQVPKPVESARPAPTISAAKSVNQTNIEARQAFENQRALVASMQKAMRPEAKPVKPVVETVKPTESVIEIVEPVVEIPKPVETTPPVEVKTYPAKAIVKESGAEFIEVDGVIEYDLYGGKEFTTLPKAQAALAESKVPNLEIVKVGRKYRMAESLESKLTDEQLVELYFKKKGASERLTPQVAEESLQKLGEQVKQWHQETSKGQPSAVDIDLVKNQISQIANEFVGDKIDAATSYLVEASDRMVSMINEKQVESTVPRPDAVGNMVGKSPVDPMLDLHYQPDGKPFTDIIEAIEWNQDLGLNGIVEKHPSAPGWVVAIKKPRRILRGKNSVLNDLKTVMKLDERGSLSFNELPKEKIEALRRLENDARAAGLSVFEYAKSIGFDEKVARGFEDLAVEIRRGMNVSKPSTGTEDFQTGERVNEIRDKVVDGYEVKNPEIFKGELKAIQAIKDPKRTGLGNISKAYVTTRQFIKELDSPFYNQLERTYHELEAIVGDRVREHSDSLIEQVKGLTDSKGLLSKIKNLVKNKTVAQSSQRMGQNLMWRQSDVRARLEAEGWTEADIPKLSEREQAFINDYIDPILKERGIAINKARVESGHNPMKLLEEDYFGIAYSEGLAARMGLEPNLMNDSAKLIQARYNKFKETPFRHLKTRSKKGLKKDLNFDAISIFDNYMRNSIRHEILTPLISKLHETLEPLKTGEFKTLEDGRIKEIMFTMGKEKPALAEWTRRWANTIAGHDTSAILSLSNAAANKAVETIARKVSKNVVAALMSGSLRSAEIQVGALRNTVARIGKRSTAYGVKEVSKRLYNGTLEGLKERSDILKTRLADVSMEEYFSGIRQDTLGAAVKVGLIPLKYVDYVTAASTWLGAENFALRKISEAKAKGQFEILKDHGIEYNSKLSDQKMAERFADNVVVETQGSSMAGDLAPVQRSALGKLVHLFQTFTISDWNFLYKDILGQGPGPKVSGKIRAKRVMDFVIATTLLNTFFEDVLNINSPMPTPIRTAMKSAEAGKDSSEIVLDLLKEFGEPLPGVGGALRFGFSPYGAVVQTSTELFQAFSDTSRRNSLLPKSLDKGVPKRLALAAEASAKLGGIPFTGQAAKMIRATKRGETPYGIIQGSYDEARKKSKRFTP